MAVDDAYTKVLLHGDGADGGTTFTDEGGNTWEIINPTYATIETDTDVKKFGTASIHKTGQTAGSVASLRMTSGLTAGMNPGSGDFTVDFQMQWNPLPTWNGGSQTFLAIFGDSNNKLYLEIGICDDESPYYYFMLNGKAGGVSLGYNYFGYNEPSFAPVAGQMYHIELCRTGNDYKIFIEGNLLETISKSDHTYAMPSGAGTYIDLFNSTIQGHDVWFDEVRYSVGIARHTSNFTPPTRAYGPSLIEETIEDLLGLTEDMAYQVNSDPTYHDVTLFEFLGLTGLSAYQVPVEELVTDSLGIADSMITGWLKTITETLFSYDDANVGWNLTATETLDLAETLNVALGLIIDEWLTIIDTETNNWNGQEIITEPLNLYSLAVGSKHYADSLTDTVDMTDAPALKLTVAVLEYLGFSDLATALKTMAQSLSDGLGLSDDAAWAFPLSVTDALACVDTATVATAFLQSIQSSMALADSVTPIKRVSHTVTDPLVLADTVGSNGTFYNVLYDTLAMNALVELDGEIYECYVLSTPKFMPSIYSGFDFNSYAVFQNRAFGANSTGIYELTGDTDAGATIQTGVILSGTDFGSHNQKRFRKGFLDISGDAPLMIFETGEGNRRVYTIDTKGKVMASHEQKSKKWKLSLARFDSLDSIQLVPIILTK